LQDSPVSLTGGSVIVTAPLAPVLATALPVGSDIFVASTWIVLEVEDVVPDTVKFAVPIVPLGITVAFRGLGPPVARQVYWPALILLQLIVLEAAEAAVPAVTLTAVKSFGENENVHITPATCAPPDEKESGRLIIEPCSAEPDAKLNVGCPKSLGWYTSSSTAYKMYR
jgi:hypothetical protein